MSEKPQDGDGSEPYIVVVRSSGFRERVELDGARLEQDEGGPFGRTERAYLIRPTLYRVPLIDGM